MGALSRSIEQGVAIGKQGGAALNQKKFVPLEDHHFPDAEHGDTVTGRINIDKDGTRSLDTAISDSEAARKDMMDSISNHGGLSMGGGN